MDNTSLRELKMSLDKSVSEASNVFICMHNDSDLDAIGSSIGIYNIIKRFNVPVYIILNDDIETIEPGVRKVINDLAGNVKIINVEKFLQLRGKNDTLIIADTNKKSLVCVNNYLLGFGDIIIIDHHKTNEQTIKADNIYVDLDASSTCEIVASLLSSYNIKMDKNTATCLLAGIMLDTSKFTKNISSQTLKISSRLMGKDKDILNYANDLLLEDFENDRLIHRLLEYTSFIMYQIAITYNSDAPKTIYKREDLAKAADYLLRYRVDAVAVLGFIKENIISISARSHGLINVGEIMEKLGGGGNAYSAAAKIEVSDCVPDELEKVKQKLLTLMVPGSN